MDEVTLVVLSKCSSVILMTSHIRRSQHKTEHESVSSQNRESATNNHEPNTFNVCDMVTEP